MNMNEPRKPAPEPEHEPMPDNFAPVWRFLGYMVLVMVAMGGVSAAVALLVRR